MCCWTQCSFAVVVLVHCFLLTPGVNGGWQESADATSASLEEIINERAGAKVMQVSFFLPPLFSSPRSSFSASLHSLSFLPSSLFSPSLPLLSFIVTGCDCEHEVHFGKCQRECPNCCFQYQYWEHRKKEDRNS